MTTTWAVSGAGTSAVNGTYTLLTTNAGSLNGSDTFAVDSTNAYSLNGGTTSCPVLVETASGAHGTYNATELRGLTAGGVLTGSTGYYYGVHSGDPTNFALIDTTNAQGSNPVPTITKTVTGGNTGILMQQMAGL